MQAQSVEYNSTGSQSSVGPMLIIGMLFFIFGFITWLNGALVPFLQIICELTETQALFAASATYIAYFVMAQPMAWVLDRVGYKNAMSLGLLIIAAGCLLFIPAAYSRTFFIFIIAQFVIGSGLTILQTASNPYIVKIGSQETAAVRISIMGLLNKGAGILAPIVFTSLVLGQFAGVTAKSVAALPETERLAQITELASGLVSPYIGMAIVLAILAVLLRRSPLPELNLAEEQANSENASGSLFQYPHLILGFVAIFLYVGVEVIAGDTIGLFGSQLGVANATTLTSYVMVFLVTGYLLGLVLIPRLISQETALLASSVLGVVLTLAIVTSSTESYGISEAIWGWSGIPTVPNTIAFIAMLGLANALVWPAVWPLALDGLGDMTAKGSALLIMGIAGGAILPLIYGLIAEHMDGKSGYWVMLPCYAFLVFYAVKGHKLRKSL
ncbi:glucose/galactose MFS transporter [Alteromonadaceae bacterium M269]|nr:glucose/galactose MFS transporter [Alteromonadaceae bacterium M269]